MSGDTSRELEIARGCEPPFCTQLTEVGWTADLTTNVGYHILVRPARPADEAALADLFRALGPEDLRHRFLSSIREVASEQIQAMARNDDPHSVSFLAFERFTGRLIATAMLVADATFDTAEFALATRPDRRTYGVSWTLLEHLVRYATKAGIRRLTSIETSDDIRAMKLEREMGFTVRACPDDAALMIAEKVLN